MKPMTEEQLQEIKRTKGLKLGRSGEIENPTGLCFSDTVSMKFR
jgi:hypothetical protein